VVSSAISRRSALRGLAVMAGAGVAGYAVARRSDAARAKRTTTAANGYGASVDGGGQRVAGLNQVPTGGGLILSNFQLVLTHDADGTVHGFSAVCTHQGCVVNAVKDDVITCPCHGSTFDARTGAVLSGPASRALPTIAVTVRDGSIFTS
jgi:Rieske Fe-S protein